MKLNRLHNIRSGIAEKQRTTSASRQLFFMITKTDAGSFLKMEDYK